MIGINPPSPIFPVGEQLKSGKEYVFSSLMGLPKSKAEEIILTTVKTHFKLNTEEMKNLQQSYREDYKEIHKKEKTSFAEIGDIFLNKFSFLTMSDSKEIYHYKNGVYKTGVE